MYSGARAYTWLQFVCAPHDINNFTCRHEASVRTCFDRYIFFNVRYTVHKCALRYSHSYLCTYPHTCTYTQEVIESPCAAITDCDDCDGTTTCHWDTHELVCKNKDADVTMVKELSHTKEPNASDDKKSTEAAEISKKKK